MLLFAETDVVVDSSSLRLSAVGLLSPRNLRVSDEWYTRFRVAWDPVAAPVQGYRLIYSPEGEVLRFSFWGGSLLNERKQNKQTRELIRFVLEWF